MDHQYCFDMQYVCNEDISNEKKSDIFIEEKDGDSFLIKLYRERPFLYNKGHKDFKDKLIKDNASNEISKIMQDKNYGNFYTPEYCQTRCLSLRNQYNREKQILNNQYKSGNAASTHKPFTFYSQLSFLDDYVQKRRTRCNIKPNEAPISSISSSELPINVPKYRPNETFDSNEKSGDFIYEKKDNPKEDKINENIKENIPQIKRKCANAEKDMNVLKIPIQKKSKVNETKDLENIFSSVSQKIINVLDNNHDAKEDEAFAQFIIAHLANLPQSEKNIKKKRITDALFSLL
ncbi:uncharacterized protein LOC113005591 [Solenopsis invicta]|uniref:uncharacterized protein LOC113005591 n=1 Tax=Solenopsis invicta TaxID=13686 RepID=UPI000E33EB3E|nr:uncharacterized protein LOC113005591 [Solenopsis invicta]XP_039310477.1 uncharacterized protein LOC113005591 [Solenopsis invicta]XP_039310479.1 uncharacterized protein LOC113005591 [Solenopsis invicta]